MRLFQVNPLQHPTRIHAVTAVGLHRKVVVRAKALGALGGAAQDRPGWEWAERTRGEQRREAMEEDGNPFLEGISENIAYFELYSTGFIHILKYNNDRPLAICKKNILGYTSDLTFESQDGMITFYKKSKSSTLDSYIFLEAQRPITIRKIGFSEKITVNKNGIIGQSINTKTKTENILSRFKIIEGPCRFFAYFRRAHHEHWRRTENSQFEAQVSPSCCFLCLLAHCCMGWLEED